MLAIAGLIAAARRIRVDAAARAGVTGIAASTAARGSRGAWRRARRTRSTAAIATVAVWIGTHALYYSLVSPAYSHAASMLTSVVVLFGVARVAIRSDNRSAPPAWAHSPALRR